MKRKITLDEKGQKEFFFKQFVENNAIDNQKSLEQREEPRNSIEEEEQGDLQEGKDEEELNVSDRVEE